VSRKAGKASCHARCREIAADPAPGTAFLDGHLTRRPGSRDILLMLALLSRDAGGLAAARDDAQQAVAADPADREAQQLLRSLAGPR
jgi:hypothetical protein